VLVAVGAFTVQGWGRTDPAGILWSAGALAGEVGFAVIAVPVLRPLGPRLLSAVVCALAAAESLLLGLVVDGFGVVRTPTTEEVLALLWQAAVVTVVGFVCWYMGMQRIGAERATLFSGLIPVSAALTAPLVGTGSYGIPQTAGSVIVGLGVALGSGVLRRRRARTGHRPGGRRRGRQPRPAPAGGGCDATGARPSDAGRARVKGVVAAATPAGAPAVRGGPEGCWTGCRASAGMGG